MSEPLNAPFTHMCTGQVNGKNCPHPSHIWNTHPQRPVASQLQRIENGLDLLLQGQTALEKNLQHRYRDILNAQALCWGDMQKELKIRLEGIQEQIKKLGEKLNSWLAEEAIAADILKKTRELKQGNAKADHTSAMRTRAALPLAKRRTATNRGSK